MPPELDTAPRMLVLHAGQRIDELVDGGAGAHAHNFAGHHVLQGSLAHQGFEFVLGHLGKSGKLRNYPMSLLPYALARPFLFGLDAETAHELTMDIRWPGCRARRWNGPGATSWSTTPSNWRA
jgi:hypothetical protein